MEWPSRSVVVIQPDGLPVWSDRLAGPTCDLQERGEELLAELQAARLTPTTEVILVIHRADSGEAHLSTLWADLTSHARAAAEQLRRDGEAATEETVRDALVHGAAAGLRGWLAFCKRTPLCFPDLPYTPCQVVGLRLEIQHYEA